MLVVTFGIKVSHLRKRVHLEPTLPPPPRGFHLALLNHQLDVVVCSPWLFSVTIHWGAEIFLAPVFLDLPTAVMAPLTILPSTAASPCQIPVSHAVDGRHLHHGRAGVCAFV